MRILILGDIHFRSSTPQSRGDDYVGNLFDKMGQAIKIAVEQECEYMVVPGDAFDVATPPLWLIRRVIREFRNHKVLCCLGQHDQRYHQGDRANTPIGVLEAAGSLSVLHNKIPFVAGNVIFYGASWGQEIPIPRASSATKILVTHRMVIKDKTLWPGQEDYAKAGALLRKYPYDLMITGDNHNFFIEKSGDRYLVNCGSLMRANADQRKHHPTVVVYDTETREVEQFPLDILPAAKVLKEVGAKATLGTASFEAFVEQVGRNRGAPDLDFLANLRKSVDVMLAEGLDNARGVATKIDEIVRMSDG